MMQRKLPHGLKVYLPLVLMLVFFVFMLPRSPRFRYEYKKGEPTELILEGRYAVAEIEVNGKPAKKLLFTNHCDLSGLLVDGKNDIVIKLSNAQRNLLGPLHNSKVETYSIGPKSFTGEKMWKDGNWADYVKDTYCFVRFGFDR